jgi:hypothetical protein
MSQTKAVTILALDPKDDTTAGRDSRQVVVAETGRAPMRHIERIGSALNLGGRTVYPWNPDRGDVRVIFKIAPQRVVTL